MKFLFALSTLFLGPGAFANGSLNCVSINLNSPGEVRIDEGAATTLSLAVNGKTIYSLPVGVERAATVVSYQSADFTNARGAPTSLRLTVFSTPVSNGAGGYFNAEYSEISFQPSGPKYLQLNCI